MTRVRIYPGGALAFLGEERYEVEWHEQTKKAKARQAADPNYEHDRDSDEITRVEHFTHKAEALKRAREIVDTYATVYGTATVTLQRVELLDGPHGVGEWNDIGNPEHVD